jgi:hypothetical protein
VTQHPQATKKDRETLISLDSRFVCIVDLLTKS